MANQPGILAMSERPDKGPTVTIGAEARVAGRDYHESVILHCSPDWFRTKTESEQDALSIENPWVFRRRFGRRFGFEAERNHRYQVIALKQQIGWTEWQVRLLYSTRFLRLYPDGVKLHRYHVSHFFACVLAAICTIYCLALFMLATRAAPSLGGAIGQFVAVLAWAGFFAAFRHYEVRASKLVRSAVTRLRDWTCPGVSIA